MVQYIQIEMDCIKSIQKIESRISSIKSKIEGLENTDEKSGFKDILIDSMQDSPTGSGIYGYPGSYADMNSLNMDMDSLNNLGNSYLADYLLNNINQVSNVTGLEQLNNLNDCATAGDLSQTGGNYSDKILEGIKDHNLFEGIISLTKKLGEEFGVDSALINAIIKIESNFNPYAVSKAGAMGLMQLMPATAEGLGVEDPYDINQNLSGGIRLIKGLIESFDGDLKLALAAYNAGSARVKEYGGIPPIEETQNFVSKVLSIYDPEIL